MRLPVGQGSHRPTFLALRDHGKVYVADLPRLSDGQLIHIAKEAQEVLDSLNRRLQELDDQISLSQLEQDTKIRATTKRDVTERFLQAIAQEQDLRRSNPGSPSSCRGIPGEGFP
jgi:hemerythrin-like domain-containing protein